MNNNKDILTDIDHDLNIKLGDFDIGYSNMQHAEFILLSEFNDWKQKPTNSFEPFLLLNGSTSINEQERYKSKAKKKLKEDGLDDNVDIEFDLVSKKLIIKSKQYIKL